MIGFTERLAEAVAKLTGETKTEAVTRALRDPLAKDHYEQNPLAASPRNRDDYGCLDLET